MLISAQLAVEAVGDVFVALHGDPAATAARSASLDHLKPGSLIFAKGNGMDVPAILRRLERGVLIVEAPLAITAQDIPEGCAVIETKNARLAFARCVGCYFAPSGQAVGVHASAVVDPGAKIDSTASIGAFVHIGRECVVGAGSRISPNVTILDKVRIGRNVTISSGTVIGADGFGYEQNSCGGYEKFPHVGGVVIEDDVEIGANSCIDRGVLNDTIVKRGARIDNLVHVAHNVEIGEDAMVIALTMLGGSVKIGDRAWVAPASTIINQKSVGKDAVVGLAAVVTKDVADGQTVMGMPAMDQAQFKAMNAALKKLA